MSDLLKKRLDELHGQSEEANPKTAAERALVAFYARQQTLAELYKRLAEGGADYGGTEGLRLAMRRAGRS